MLGQGNAHQEIINCTVIANHAANVAGGVYVSSHTLHISNTIIWGNTHDEGEGETVSPEGAQLLVRLSVAVATVDYCCVQDWSGDLGGTGNIGSDPLFANPSGGDYHLLSGSPCIDTGDNAAVTEATDLDGNPRILDGDCILGAVVDMGAYEAPQSPPNTAPVIDAISAPLDPLPVPATIAVGASFTDPDVGNSHTATWDWGDNSTSPGTVIEEEGSVAGTHVYTTAGVYTVKLTVVGDGENSAQSAFRYVVVYDAEGGFVTGGGWIDSPEGAYAPDPSLTGKATFGFVSKYKKGAKEPTGETEFQFKVADLNFHSTSYDWLVVAGHKAKYKGGGTINGGGNYGFMLSAVDEKLTPSTDVDRFRIKIWDKDNGDAVVYDNQMGADEDAVPATAIGGGSIVIHKSK